MEGSAKFHIVLVSSIHQLIKAIKAIIGSDPQEDLYQGAHPSQGRSRAAGPLTHIDDDNSHRNFSYFDIYTTNNFDDDTMKFLTLAGFFLLLVAGTMTAVDAATEAEQACGFARKIGSPCTIKLDGQHSIPGTCQKKAGLKLFRHRTCIPNNMAGSTSSSTAAGAPPPASATSSPDTGSTSTGAGAGDGTYG
ncbi:hypothetical protein C8R41DRAFT_921964 [Lentinula lateritia]|uniref:CBM1 domain-containing protein n=1 Tax=Lentinula lateritia TaxID=40482 RepID=A0ABQ8VA87_9AGAR|nr:hypothetical protein C8R41DRAFT_921964 [Lentinula lateritia]